MNSPSLLLGPRRGRRAPPARSDAWAFTPDELRALGLPGSAETAFAALQRPWRWNEQGPELGARASQELVRLGLECPRIAARKRSVDGATKLLFESGGDRFEAVHMPREIARGRVTLCVSSQVGCALGCQFCATAALGLERHLSAGEIVAQVLVALRALGPRHPGDLTLVFMGMGEPLHNLAAVARAIRILTEPGGLGLSVRRMTVSTAGLVPQLDELARLERRPLLAVSLNATTDDLRSELMPINRRYPLAELKAALSRFPCRPRERITVEYVLLAGINDRPEDAVRLADYCAGFPHLINLIPFNAHAGARFRAPDEATLEAFAGAVLARRPTLLSVRRSRGQDVGAACGQLNFSGV